VDVDLFTHPTPGIVAAPEILPVGTFSVRPGGSGDEFQNVRELLAHGWQANVCHWR